MGVHEHGIVRIARVRRRVRCPREPSWNGTREDRERARSKGRDARSRIDEHRMSERVASTRHRDENVETVDLARSTTECDLRRALEDLREGLSGFLPPVLHVSEEDVLVETAIAKKPLGLIPRRKEREQDMEAMGRLVRCGCDVVRFLENSGERFGARQA